MLNEVNANANANADADGAVRDPKRRHRMRGGGKGQPTLRYLAERFDGLDIQSSYSRGLSAALPKSTATWQ